LDVYKDWLGIPEDQRPPNHYQLLRLKQFEDDSAKVQKNYKKLNEHVRKFASGQYQKESQDLLNELARAMLCLTDPERKREYDESLGRVFEESAGTDGKKKPLGRVLVERGVLTKDQAKEANDFAEARGLSMRDAVVQLKLTDWETATEAYAQELGRPYVDLSQMIPDDTVLDKIPRSTVKRNAILPLFIDDEVLLVACAYEPTPDLEEEMQLRVGVPMRSVMATPKAVNQGIAHYYPPGTREDVADPIPTPGGKPAKKAKSAKGGATEARKPMAQLSEGEQKERKQVGFIIMLWAVIGSAAIDNFLLPKSLLISGLIPALSFLPFLLTLIIPPIVIWYVLKVYWK
jgi:hypothetical protein